MPSRDYVAWMLAGSRARSASRCINAGGGGGLQGECARLRARRRGAVLWRLLARDRSGRCSARWRQLGDRRIRCTSIATISAFAGNAETALATIAAAEGLPLHLAHLQFYGYGNEGRAGFSSAAPRLAEAVNARART